MKKELNEEALASHISWYYLLVHHIIMVLFR